MDLQFGKNRLPMIYQSEASECGLACVAMISAYHGHKVDMNTLRSRMGVSIKGSNLRQIVESAQDILHLGAHPVKCELEELDQLDTPCMLHWKLTHFVVLHKVKKDKIVVHDPDVGIRVYSMAEVSRYFTGIATTFYPTKNFEYKDEERRLKIGQLWTKSLGLTGAIVQLFALALLLQVVALATPFYMQTVVDRVLMSNDQSLLVTLALGFALMRVFQIVISWLRELIMLRVGTQLSLHTTSIMNNHLMRLPMSFFETRHIGDILSRFGSLGPIRNLFSSGIISAVLDGIMAITTLAMMFFYSPLLTSIVLGAVLIYAIVRVATYRPLKQMTEQKIESGAVENSVFMENIRSIQSIKLFNRENERESIWRNALTTNFNDGIRLAKFNIYLGLSNTTLFAFEGVLVVFLAALLVQDNVMTIGMMYAFMSYKGNFSDRITALIEQAIGFRMLKMHLSRISDIALTDKEDVDRGSLIPKPVTGDLALKNVSFCYASNETPVLKDINMNIRAGEFVVIRGCSGIGKTTLIKLLVGLLQPTSGRIEIDDIPARDYGPASVRSYFSAVMQNDQLLSGTIAENISMFDAERNDIRLTHAAKQARLHDTIMSFPMKYDSLIGDMGSALSGGQRQRVLLARALYKDPRVLVLDEGTSNLDVNLEREIMDTVSGLELTRIIVSHNPAVVERADRVFVLDHMGLREEVSHKRAEEA
jgi:ATP-binding cassette subfamily B protein RaxB